MNPTTPPMTDDEAALVAAEKARSHDAALASGLTVCQDCGELLGHHNVSHPSHQ